MIHQEISFVFRNSRKKWNYLFYFAPTVRYIRERRPNSSNYPVWYEKGPSIQ